MSILKYSIIYWHCIGVFNKKNAPCCLSWVSQIRLWFQVNYQTELFLDKNKDYVIGEHQALLSASSCPFVSGLFPPLSEESSKTSKFSSIGSQFKVHFIRYICSTPEGLLFTSSRFISISFTLQQQLQALLETLSATEPHYIRCVKPNNLLKPAIFENSNVLQQLRCGVSFSI